MTYEEAQGKWLVVTTDQVAAINACLPEDTRVMAISANGTLVLGADLLTDCGSGGTYEAAAEILEGLEIMEWAPASSEE